MDKFRIRLARTDDVPAISRLLRRVARRWVMPDQPPEAVEALEASLGARPIRGRLAAGQRFYLAFVDGVLAGVTTVRGDSHVVHLFVGTRYQGRGISRKLWERLRNDCVHRAGTRAFTLNATKAAVPVYLHLGFVRDRDPRRPRGKVVAVPMIYRVDAALAGQRRGPLAQASRTGTRVAGESARTASKPRQAAARWSSALFTLMASSHCVGWR